MAHAVRRPRPSAAAHVAPPAAVRRRRPPASRAAGPRPSRRRQPERSAGSRERLFAAAATEFAARGFAGASVDRIAGAAGLNKAMIYYHFTSKAALYRDILREMFEAVARRVSDTAR